MTVPTAYDLYLDLLARTLTGILWEDPPIDPWHAIMRNEDGEVVSAKATGPGVYTLEPGKFDAATRESGRDWPATAATMVGLRRLENLRDCIESIIANGVQGDLLEAGVWRGGACIFMRAVLDAIGGSRREVWAADSFEGLPPPTRAEDEGDAHSAFGPLRVSLAEVKRNVAAFGFDPETDVRYIAGFFKDTLPRAAAPERLAILRVDCDMYESTLDVLRAFYHRIEPGGFCIVDDYNLPGARKAVADYFIDSGLPELRAIDEKGVFWRVERF